MRIILKAIIHSLHTIEIIVLYESKRYLFSSRSYILLLISILPMLVLLSFTANQAAIELSLRDPSIFETTMLLAYTLYSYLISIVVVIVVVADIVGGESSLEILTLATSRFNLFLGKLLAIIIILAVSHLYVFWSFVTVLFSFNVPLPALERLLLAWIVGFLSSIIPLSFAMCSSCLSLKLNLSSHTAAYFTIFIFFVIPMIFYSSSFQLGVFQIEIFNLTINSYILNISSSIIDPTNIFSSEYLLNLYSTIIGFTLVLLFLAYIFFATAPIY